MRSDVDCIARLFRGRTDAYGTDHGSCVHEPVTLQLYERHLDGTEPCGIYPLLDDGTAWFGCTDIDQGRDEIAPAVNIWRTFTVLGLPSYVERSRSKGFHVWQFYRKPMPAQTIRAAFLYVHQVAGVPAREVNPKASSLDGITLGNYIRIPYPHRGALGRQVIIDMERADRCPLSVDEFIQRVELVDLTALVSVASRYVPPPPRRSVAVGDYDGNLEGLTPRMDGLTYAVFTRGPMEHQDRSSSMVHLCYLLARGGFTPSEAMAVLTDYDDRVQKFVGRPDRDIQLTKMIERAFG